MKRGRAAAAALAAALTALPGAAPALADPAPFAPAAVPKPNVGRIVSTWLQPDQSGVGFQLQFQFCSGFGIAPTPRAESNRVATAAHCIYDGRFADKVRYYPPAQAGGRAEPCRVTSADLRPGWLRSQGLSSEELTQQDVAKLTLGCTLPWPQALTGTVPSPGTEIGVYGFPKSEPVQWRLLGTVEPSSPMKVTPLPQVGLRSDQDELHGMSGAPLTGRDGKVFGVLSSGTSDGKAILGVPLTCEVREWLVPGSCPQQPATR